MTRPPHGPHEAERPPENQPGLRQLRAAVSAMARRATPPRATLANDALAGLTVTIGSIPSAMANGLLAGVNPIYGLYGNMAGMTVGGALASTQLMVINTTAVAALVAGQSLTGVSAEDRPQALFLMVILAGLIQLAFGALKFGRLTRFVSFSVMTGFVAGIAVVLIMSQLQTMTGYDAVGANEVVQTADLLVHLGDIDVTALAMALLALVLVTTLPRTPLDKGASLLAIAIPTGVVAVLGADSVVTVADVGEIPSALPLPALPTLSVLTLELLGGAFAVAVVSLVQAAGVSQSLPRTSGARGSMSRDFVAQGAANVASGLVRGLPVGGSLSGTALNVTAGGQKRWASILGGVWTVVLVAAFSGAITNVVMPALGALLLYAAVKSIQPDDVAVVWYSGWPARLGAVTTFVCTLLLPIQVAVLIGIALAAALHVAESSTDIVVVALVERPDGQIEEQPAPERLPGGAVTVLGIYGSLFYAGARTLQRRLPGPGPQRRPAVVLRLRGHGPLGATAVDVLADYARQLRAVDGQLYVSGLSAKVRDHLLRTGGFTPADGVHIYEATPVLAESSWRARREASEWLLQDDTDSSDDDGTSGDD